MWPYSLSKYYSWLCLVSVNIEFSTEFTKVSGFTKFEFMFTRFSDKVNQFIVVVVVVVVTRRFKYSSIVILCKV